jgi:FKBP-type peptidyl-prolyl cis-trans isomerase
MGDTSGEWRLGDCISQGSRSSQPFPRNLFVGAALKPSPPFNHRMKLQRTLTLGVLAFGLVAGASAQEIKVNVPGDASAGAKATAAAPAAEPSAPASFTEAQVIESLGWYMGVQSGLASYEFTPAQLASVVKGLELAAQGKDAPYALEKIGPAIQEYVQGKQRAWVAKLKKESETESAALFTKLKENKNVTELPSGLCYEVLKQGEGPAPKLTDTVVVHYTGTLVNGTVFDTSREARAPGVPAEPAEFVLGEVIPGWSEGLQRISKGGHMKLYIPAKLAYGDRGQRGIPPGSALIFDVELLDVKATPAPEAAPAPAAAPAAK